jgi:hypothetical protein
MIGLQDTSVDDGRGGSATYAIRKLRRSRPDLHAKVLAGELSPHAAMVQAGFRPKVITVPLDVEKAAAALARAFTEDEMRSLQEQLARITPRRGASSAEARGDDSAGDGPHRRDAPHVQDSGVTHREVTRRGSVTVVRDPEFTVGRPEWFARSTAYVRHLVNDAGASCAPLGHHIPALRKHFKTFFQGSWEEYCRDELCAEPELVERLEEGVAIIKRAHAARRAEAELFSAAPPPGPRRR